MALETYGLLNTSLTPGQKNGANMCQATLDKEWKSTCRAIFGQEIGDMNEYEAYLKEPLVGKSVRSCFSGKELWVTSPHYAGNAKFFDYNAEANEIGKLLAKPVDINNIKDIDSLFEAVGEKLIYSGNKTLGNSSLIENSDNITDSTCVLNSSMIINGKYVAYSYMCRKSEYAFACTSSGDSSMMIRCFYNNSLRRCFECITTVNSSDCYFCHNVSDSADCLFTFNERVKRNMIGNVQLTKEQYAGLKAKLMGEIITDLKKRKRTLSLLDIVGE